MKAFNCFVLFYILHLTHLNLGLENGLARKPPMGWLSWTTFWCETDCDKHPLKCLNEKQMVAMADCIVKDGFRDLGYEYVITDDCWLAKDRDAQGKLQPDPKRFSKGIKWLADYMHNNKLKYGIYEDYGTKTCDGFPGSIGRADEDSQTFASWGVDYLKIDGCNANVSQLDEGYPAFRVALNKTGRQIVYSCEWPFYTQLTGHQTPNYTAVRENCNLWRVYNDIYYSWPSLLSVIDYIDEHQDVLISVSGPGGWTDPDMLVIGNAGISEAQAKVQMALWCIWSAPLLISTDLRFITEPFKRILQNTALIAINQDPLGIMGRMVIKTPSVSVYIKPVTPVDNATGDHSYAIAFLNRNSQKQANVNLRRLSQLGLKRKTGYAFEDLFENNVTISLGPDDAFSTVIEPTGVRMYKATLIK